MARFNSKKTPKIETQRTTNLAGGPAFTQSWKEELVSILLTSMVQDQFYRSAQGGLDRLTTLVQGANNADGPFVAKAALYARNEFGLRSITHIMAYMIGEGFKGNTWTKRFFEKIVRRPDDMAEILGLVYQHKQPIPNAMKKGFAAALQGLDMYQVGKYQMGGRNIKLVDIVNLVHPKNTGAIHALVNGTLNVKTWETELSAAGQQPADNRAAAKSKAWVDLLKDRRLGYMALLKNLRNIAQSVDLEQCYPTCAGTKTGMQMVVEQLTDRKAIKKSLVFPFRFVTAYDEIAKAGLRTADSRMLMVAINDAAEVSLDNVPKFKGSTLVVMDQSGSMNTAVGTSTAAKVGGLFAAMLWKANVDCDVITFGTRANYVGEKMRQNSLMNLAENLGYSNQGGTNFSYPFVLANRAYDRIIILSDMQGWMDSRTPFDSAVLAGYFVRGAFYDYQKKFKCHPHLYSFDLCGYGSLQFPEDRVYLLAGFSDKILDVMSLLETDRNALIHKIEAVDL
jgi:phage regulator Rha-like protein